MKRMTNLKTIFPGNDNFFYIVVTIFQPMTETQSIHFPDTGIGYLIQLETVIGLSILPEKTLV